MTDEAASLVQHPHEHGEHAHGVPHVVVPGGPHVHGAEAHAHGVPHVVGPGGPHVHGAEPHVHGGEPHLHGGEHIVVEHHAHGVVPHVHEKHHVQDPVKGAIQGLIAFTTMVFAIILFGLIAFQVNSLGVAAGNQTQVDQTPVVGGRGNHTVFGAGNQENHAGNDFAHIGLNGAGRPMLFFGLIFAVLQAVAALTMFTQLTRLSHKGGHSTVTSVLKVTVAMGFLAMGLACRHINLGVPDQADPEHVSITHAIESFLIINWFIVWVFLIMSLFDLPNWNSHDHIHNQDTRQYAVSITQFLAGLLLIGLFAGHFQIVTANNDPGAGIDNGLTTWLFEAFGVLFAVLQFMSGLTMYQQCTRQRPHQNCETVTSILKVTIAFGILAFGFACRHIQMGLPEGMAPNSAALLIALEAFVIINFFITLFVHFDAHHYDWDSLCPHDKGRRCKPFLPGVIQTILALILVGLLAGETQHLTESQDSNFGRYGLNGAGLYMIGFGLIFSVFQLSAGLTMFEHMVKSLKGRSVNLVIVTNKVATAVGFLAMGFACRHIYLGLQNGEPRDSDENSNALVHTIEAFLIINGFTTWFIQTFSGVVEW